MEAPPPPDPEIHLQMKLKCYCCSRKMRTTYDNTAYFVYPKQPWFNHTRTVCNKGGINVNFIDMNDEQLVEFAEQFVRATSPTGFCDDEEYLEFFRGYKGITDVAPHELNQGEQRIIDFTHYIMDSIRTIDDL